MSETTKGVISPKTAAERVEAGLAARRSRERRFRTYGRIAIGIALAFLARNAAGSAGVVLRAGAAGSKLLARIGAYCRVTAKSSGVKV